MSNSSNSLIEFHLAPPFLNEFETPSIAVELLQRPSNATKEGFGGGLPLAVI
jgi:hypothetical protein